MSFFNNQNLLRFLPIEYEIRDSTYGDLSSFLEVIAVSVSDFETFVEDFTNIFDVDTCDAKYLPYLAKMINYPLSDRDNEDSKRTQLRHAVEWYKKKGLHEGFRILFYSLGYAVNLVDLWTRDYQSFYRYPGSWVPSVSKAKAVGNNLVMMTITDENKNLRISIDGGVEIPIQLTTGLNRFLIDIVSEIDSALNVVDGDCYQDLSGKIVISSRITGESSTVRLVEVAASAYQILGLKTGIYYGIDYRVPNTWPELQENGGSWYKSPHFGIEVFSIKGYVTDPEEFDYIRSRIELIRPAHTVLDYIKYAKDLADLLEVEEDEFIGEIESRLADVWPYANCMDRGRTSEYEYIRNGLVPNRSESTRILFRHFRSSLNNARRRDSFVYDVFNLSRSFPAGPPQMPNRSAMLYAREGYMVGDPLRNSCSFNTEEVEMYATFDDPQHWCTEILRDGGVYKRDNPTDYLRDGSFTLLTWRGQCEFTRMDDESKDGFTREICKNIVEQETELMMFERPDLPGVWFRDLVTLSDPDAIGLGLITGPGDTPI